jgi:DtxR family transcriptional regulator, Mn-dependent transcriptional regulator
VIRQERPGLHKQEHKDPMEARRSQSIEDYLKGVYELTTDEARVSTGELARHLEITPASATGMAQTLAGMIPPLLDYQKHRGVALTKKGQLVALEVVRHHRLIELFLHETLGLAWDEVHDEAELLEHVLSERLEARIAERLGDPQHDPHGDPIPDERLKLPVTSTVRLKDLPAGSSGVVRRVTADRDPALLRHLGALGLRPPARVRLLERSPFDQTLKLEVEGVGEDVVVGEALGQRVYVQPDPEPSLLVR